MIVRIDKNVHVQIAEFYAISMALHPTLDEVTVEKKKSRLYDAIRALEKYITYRRLPTRFRTEQASHSAKGQAQVCATWIKSSSGRNVAAFFMPDGIGRNGHRRKRDG